MTEKKGKNYYDKLQNINGVIKGVVYQNEGSGFSILKIFANGRSLIASGNFFDMAVMDSKIKLTGKFVYHKKYGYQFNFTDYEVSLATTKTAIIDYLSSSIFKGIGKALANAIYDKFKEETLNIMDNVPEKLRDVRGIGDVKMDVILEGVRSSVALRKSIIFFKPYQFTDYQIKAIYDTFKDRSIKIARENPYTFTEIKGVGFKKADVMAEKLGVSRDDPNRIKEAVKYLISEICADKGHTFVYFKDIKNGIKDIIQEKEIDDETLKKYILALSSEKKIIMELASSALPSAPISSSAPISPALYPPLSNNVIPLNIAFSSENADLNELSDAGINDINMLKIYLPPFYYSELRIAKELKRLWESKKEKTPPDDKEIEAGIALTEEQKKAVLNALKYKISIISGGPGTGKSTIIKVICDMYPDKNIALTSLSGKAAQRLADIIYGRNGNKDINLRHISTIHRLLKATINRETRESYFTYNENNRLPYDLIIVDEMSMVDVIIFSNLLKALNDEARLVLVGDVNQLPSVNPGDVLRDLIYSDRNKPAVAGIIFPVTFLTKVFRQNEGGLININAHNLLNNKKFSTYYDNYKDKKRASEFIIKYKKDYDEKETGKVALLNDFVDFVKRIKLKRLNSGNYDVERSEISDSSERGKIILEAEPPWKKNYFNDIQVLTPVKRGDLGYFKLNEILQDIFNPVNPVRQVDQGDTYNLLRNSAERIYSESDVFICNGIQFRINDRVIQKKNNYDLDVFNGDSGYITKIDYTNKTLSVGFLNFSYVSSKDEINKSEILSKDSVKTIEYNFLDVYDNLSLAYALSIHKSQGSEFDNVIIIFHQSHYMMLKKDLLYTAITRGKKNVVIFGTYKAFSIAAHSEEEIRNSGLNERLKEVFKDYKA